MLFKIRKMTPRCWKQLPDGENTGDSQIPGLVITSIRTGLQKKLLMPNTAESHDSTVYSVKGSLDSLENMAPASVCKPIWLLHGVFITGKSRLPSDEYTVGYDYMVANTLRGHDSPVGNLPGS